MIERKRKLQPFKEEVVGGNTLVKRWRIAQRKHSKGTICNQNFITELIYHEILQHAKTLYSRLPEALKNPVFEKDYKSDTTENAVTMHCLVTHNFYWNLECSFDYIYRINYDFQNCPFENEIMKLIENEHSCQKTIIRTSQKPNCLLFYRKVIQVQNPEHIYLLIENSSNVCKLHET